MAAASFSSSSLVEIISTVPRARHSSWRSTSVMDRCDEGSHLLHPLLANALHFSKLFDVSEGAMRLSVRQNPLRQFVPNSGKFQELFPSGRIEIDGESHRAMRWNYHRGFGPERRRRGVLCRSQHRVFATRLEPRIVSGRQLRLGPLCSFWPDR